MSKMTPEYALELIQRQAESRRRYAESRKKTHRKIGVEVSPLAAHALHVLAKSDGVSQSVALTRILERIAEKQGIELPDPLVAALAEWDNPDNP